MPEREVLLKALDEAHWELSEAVRELPDADVWTRPHPRLLSVGELLVHMTYWEAKSFLGDGFESPLVSEAVRYYTSSVEEPFQGSLDAEAVTREAQRVHEACKAGFLALSPELGEKNPNRGDWTWEATLLYQAFHVAYHTGQIYSVRHLLGHPTIDN